MFKTNLLILFAALSLAAADQAGDLRNAVDSKLQEKIALRNDRNTLLDQLHIFSDNREVKKTNLDTREKYLLYAYRDYFSKNTECDGLDYQRLLLNDIGSVDQLGDCLPSPPTDSAKNSQRAFFQNDFLPPITEIIQRFYDEQWEFIQQWIRESNHYDVLSQIYYPSTPYQKLYACLMANPGQQYLCDSLQAYAERVQEIYGHYRERTQYVGFSARGPSIYLSYVIGRQQQMSYKISANNNTLLTEGPSLQQSEQACREVQEDKLQLANSRLVDKNGVRDNLEFQRGMVSEYLGYANEKVQGLSTKTEEAGVIVDHLHDVELL